jgi:hypothetical protein
MAKTKVFDISAVVVEPPHPTAALVPLKKTPGVALPQAGYTPRVLAPDTGELPFPASDTMDPSWSGLPPALSHPSAAAARVSLLHTMQRQRGNAYVQQMLNRTLIDEPVEPAATVDRPAGFAAGETPPSSQVVAPSQALPTPSLPEPTAVAQAAKAEKDKQAEATAVKQKVDEAAKEVHTRTTPGTLPAARPAPAAGLPPKEAAAAARTKAEAEAAAPGEAIQKPATAVPSQKAAAAKPPPEKTPPARGAAEAPAMPAAGAAPPEAALEAKAAVKEVGPSKVRKDGAVPSPGGKPGPQALAGGAPAADSAAPSGDAADIAGFQTQLSTRIAAIPHPNLGPAGGGATRISSAGQSAAAAHGTRRTSLPKEAQAAVAESPKVKEPPPVDPDPVPEAAELVNRSSNLILAPQPMPALQNSPLGTVPVLGTAPVPEPRPGEPPPESPQKKEAEAKAPQDKKKAEADKAKQGATQKADEKPKEGDGKPLEPMVIEDKPPPPMPPLPKPFKADMGKVLAHLLADSKKEADDIVSAARKAVLPGGVLDKVYPDFGKDLAPEVESTLVTQLNGIRDAAGIGEKELQAAVEDRQKELEEQKKDASGAATQAGADAKKDIKTEGQKTQNQTAGERKKQDELIEKKVAAVSGGADPEVVKSQRDRQLTRIEQQVAQQTVAYTKARERRERQLSQAENFYILAYRRADQIDQQAIQKEPAKYGTLAAGQNLKWLNDTIRDLQEQVRGYKKNAATITEDRIKALATAGTQAHSLIRAWADTKLGQERSWWQKLFDQFSDWSRQSKVQTEAWETQKNAETKDAVVRDLATVDGLVQAVGEDVDLATLDRRRDLTEEQKAIIRAYLTPGPGGRDPISAVAAGLRVRMAQRQSPDLVAKMDKKLLEKVQEEQDFNTLDQLGAAQRPGFKAKDISSKLHNAMAGWGTEEEEVYAALANLTPLQSAIVRKRYQSDWGNSLDADIDDEFSGEEKRRAQALLEGKQATADAAALREAVSGGITGLGTDEKTIWQTLRNKTPEEREAIAAEYRKLYNVELKADLEDDLSGHDMDRANALLAGQTAKADAIAIDAAMRGGTGIGTDESDIEDVYKQIRQEVASAHPDWSSTQVEAEVARRNQEVEVEFSAKYSKDYGVGPEASALRQAFKEDLSGPELDLANAMADNNLVAADAARIKIEADGVYTSDDTVNKLLQAQYERALDTARRDQKPAMQRELQKKIEEQRKSGKPMTQDEINKAQRQIDRDIEQLAREGGKKNMEALEKQFDSKYTDWYGAGEDGERGGLKSVIKMNMSGEDQKKAYELVKEGGYLSPAQQIWYAVEQAGTDEDALKNALKGRTKKEIDEIKKEWAEKHPGVDFNSRIMSEVEGRDAFDVGELLLGEPETPQARMDALTRRYNYEKHAYGAGGYFASAEEKALDKDYEDAQKRFREFQKAEEAYNKLSDPNAKLTEEDKKKLQTAFERQNELRSGFEWGAGNVDIAAEDYRKGVDRVTDQATQIIGAVVAITVAVVLTVVTGGTAAPAMIALAASLWGTAATVATKLIMLGSAYGLEDLGTDLAIGAVDAAVSVATAGVGDKLLKAAKGVPPGALARMAQSSSKVAQYAAKGLAQGAEQLLQAAPNALAANVLNDKNWQGDAFKNIMHGTLTQTGIGLGMGLGMSAAMHLGGTALGAARDAWREFRGPKTGMPEIDLNAKGIVAPEKLPPGAADVPAGKVPELPVEAPKPTARPTVEDPHAHLGTPAERKAGWHTFQEKNPSASYDDYLRMLEDGSVPRPADPNAAAARLEQNMRDELLKGIPDDLRSRFGGVPVDVMSDAEFAAFTRSQKGQAVVIIEHGEPRVIVRESADIRALREEGIHLQQALEPQTAGKVQLLDEKNLAQWDKLSVGEKLDLYRTKLELEIDAQKRLLTGLSDDLAKASGDLDLQRSLRQQIEEAEQTLGNLSKRIGEVDTIHPEQRLRIEKGLEPLPGNIDLEQPSRLFSKKTERIQAGEITAIKDSPESRRGKETYRVGDSWLETKPDGTQRRYRRVKVVEDDGAIHYRTEIWQPDDRNWVQRGSESVRKGATMEEASQLMTAAEAKKQAAVAGEQHIAAPKEMLQTASGQGFDEVVFKFEKDGSLKKVSIIEVKDYPGGSLTLEDFTAVYQNFKRNLQDLEHDLERAIGAREIGKWGLDLAQAEKVLKALKNRELEVEVRIGPTTKLGEKENGTILADLQRKLRQQMHTQNIEVPNRNRIDKSFADEAEALARIREIAGTEQTKQTRLTELAAAPSGRSLATVKQAETALLAEAVNGVQPPLSRSAATDGRFFDKAGRPVDVRAPASSKAKPLDLSSMAQDLLTQLRTPVSIPGGYADKPRPLVINTLELSKADLKVLKKRLTVLAKQEGDPSLLVRIVYVP